VDAVVTDWGIDGFADGLNDRCVTARSVATKTPIIKISPGCVSQSPNLRRKISILVFGLQEPFENYCRHVIVAQGRPTSGSARRLR
jgi:hypothetical protein